jgi:hypothetical protein
MEETSLKLSSYSLLLMPLMITEVPYSDKGEEMQSETGMPFEVTFIAVVGDRLIRDKLTKELKQTPFSFSI